jgi:hypothetical protein
MRYFPPVSAIPLGTGLSLSTDNKVEAVGGSSSFTASLPAVIPPTNFYLSPQIVSDTYTTLALIANRVIWIPFVPMRNYTVTGLAVTVTTALASSLARVGIFASDSDGKPTGSSLLTSSNLDCSSTGKKEDTTVSLSITGGTLYYLAVHGSSTQTLRGISRTSLPHLFVDPTTTVGIDGWYINNQTFASGMPSVSASILPYNTTTPAPYLKVTA